MAELPPEAIQALRQARPEMPAMLRNLYPNHAGAIRKPTPEQAIYLVEQYMVTAVMAQLKDVITVTATRDPDGTGLTIRVIPAE